MRSRGWVWGLVLFCLAGSATAADSVYRQGDYEYRLGPVPAFVERHEIPAQWPAGAIGEQEGRWRYWLLDQQVDRRPGTDTEYIEHVYEPRSSELVADAAKFTIEFNPLYQALTLHAVQVRRDGAWQDRFAPDAVSLVRRESDFEQDMSDGTVSALIVLGDIRPGDVVRIAYSIRGQNPILAGSLADGGVMNWVHPILDRYFRVLYPPGTEVAVYAGGGAAAPARRHDAQAVEVAAHLHAVAGELVDDALPAWYQSRPSLMVARKRRWADVVAWALPLYPPDPALPPELESRIAQWRAIGDPYQRVGAVLTAVQEEIRYFGVEMGDNTHRPAPPAETWVRRYGDCKDKAYLLVSILRRLGFRAEPALVSTRNGRAIADFTPAASVFNHVIARVQIEGRDYWLDGTATQQRGDLRERDMGQYGAALPVAAGVSAPVPIAHLKQVADRHRVVERFVPSADGTDIDLEVRTTLAGSAADSLRRDLASRGPEQVARGYADFYRKRYGRLDVVAPLTSQDDPARNIIELQERYRLHEAWGLDRPPARLLDVYAEGLSRGADLPDRLDRHSPLAVNGPEHYEHDIAIELPADWSWNGSNDEERIDNPAFAFASRIGLDGRTFRLHQQLDVNADHIELAAVPDYLRDMRKVSDDMNLRIILQPSGPVRQTDRDRRLSDLLKQTMDTPAGAQK